MKKLIVLVMVVAALVTVGVMRVDAGLKDDRSYGTDWRCMRDCQKKGYSWSLCKSRCSY